VPVFFRLQFTSNESDVEDYGDDSQPTQVAVDSLIEELREHLGKGYWVDSIESDADDADFLGCTEN
jgi:hypothetical protein